MTSHSERARMARNSRVIGEDYSLSELEFARFLAGLAMNQKRRWNLAREKRKPFPISHTLEQAYEAESERLLQMIATEQRKAS